MFGTEIVLHAIGAHKDPITSSELAVQLSDSLDNEAVYKTLNTLATQGLIEKVGRLPVPAATRRKGSPTTAWAYQMASAVQAEEAEEADVATASSAQDAKSDLDAALAKALRERVEAAEDPADPEVALDPPESTVEHYGYHTRAPRPAPRAALHQLNKPKQRQVQRFIPDDPVILEIEREGYRLLEPMQQSRMIAARVQAGLPFIGQRLADKVPTWWASLEELVAMHIEAEAEAENAMQEAA